MLKSDIEIVPVYHRLTERFRAHALICFLALILHCIMRMRLNGNGGTRPTTRALRTLAQTQRHTATIGGQPYSGLTRPSPEQRELFDQLDIPAPKDER